MVRVVQLAGNPHILSGYFAFLKNAAKCFPDDILVPVRRRAVNMPGRMQPVAYTRALPVSDHRALLCVDLYG